MDTNYDIEEYNNWKNNIPFLYDRINSRVLEWPSLTTQWLPTIEITPDDLCIQKLLLGTHTTNDSNHLLVAKVQTPVNQIDQTYFSIDNTVNENGKIKIVQEFLHPGEVNRARYMPQNQNIVATKSPSGDVLLYNIDEERNNDNDDSLPILILKGHVKEGYGLAWNKGTLLASGSDDKLICVWDIQGQQTGKESQPIHIFEAHDSVVEDVAWHPKYYSTLASVSDDKKLLIWDIRLKKPVKSLQAHSSEINTIDFNPNSEHIFATGSSDKTSAIWDMRNISTNLHVLKTYVNNEEVFQVKWAPELPTILASCENRKLNIWDLSKIGEEQTVEDSEDGPPELMFVHSGHTAKISEFAWNPLHNWTISSVAEDNIVQVWRVAEYIYDDDC